LLAPKDNIPLPEIVPVATLFPFVTKVLPELSVKEAGFKSK